MAHTTFQIGELAARSGMTPDTLRYYERSAQLLPNLRRAPSRFGEPPTPSDPNCSLLFNRSEKTAELKSLTIWLLGSDSSQQPSG